MTPDEAIEAMWEIENDCLDAGDLMFRAASDMWWGVTAMCSHVGYRSEGKGGVLATSNGGADLSTAFTALLDKFRAAHADVPREPAASSSSERP